MLGPQSSLVLRRADNHGTVLGEDLGEELGKGKGKGNEMGMKWERMGLIFKTPAD